MKWMKWGMGGAAALLAGAALTFAVLAVGGTASAEEGPSGMASRFADLLAQKLGISTDQLKSASTAARNQLADELLAAGTITQAQADRIKAADIGSVFAFRGGGPGGPGGRGMHSRIAVNVAEITAKLGNISVDTVRQELKQGKSFAQIAAERGVSRETLKNAVIAAEKAALQAKVANGALTQAQADQIAQNLSAHVDQMIDHTGGGHMDGAGRRGPHPSGTPPTGAQ